MKIKVRYLETSQPIEFNAVNTYTKGPLYCIYLGKDIPVKKIPLCQIFDIDEGYNNA